MTKLNLSEFLFTSKSDAASASSLSLDVGAAVNALEGNDVLSASVVDDSDGVLYEAFSNGGSIDLGKGDDTVGAAISRADAQANTVALLNGATAAIYGGDGGDVIGGRASGLLGCKGLVNFGIIDGGSGRDFIYGYTQGESIYAWGVANGGTILGGDGADVLTGSSGAGAAIYNSGMIDMGAGSDEITGAGGSGSAIENAGSIIMGDGNDVIDAAKGGFYNYGVVSFGGGNDALKGFNIGNSGAYDGGFGIDRILLGDGVYVINSSTGVVSASGTSFNLYTTGFERIGGLSGGLFAFATGTMTVDGGVATFVA